MPAATDRLANFPIEQSSPRPANAGIRGGHSQPPDAFDPLLRLRIRDSKSQQRDGPFVAALKFPDVKLPLSCAFPDLDV